MPSFSIGQLDVATNKLYVPKIEEQFMMNRPLFKKLYDKKKKLTGGQDIRVPVRFDANASGGAWAGGVATLDATFQENVTHAIFEPAFYYTAMMVPQTYLWLNKGQAKLTVIMENQAESALNTLNKTLGLDIHGAGGLNSAGARKIDGIQAIMTQSADPSYAAFGRITRVGASGSWSNPIGNAFWNAIVFAANANTTVTGWSHSEVIDNLTTLSLNKLQQIVSFAKRDDVDPEFIVSGRRVYNAAVNLLQTYRRYENADDMGKAGFKKGIMYDTAMLVADDSANSGELSVINTEDLALYVSPEADFLPTDFRKPVNQEVLIKYIFLCLSMTAKRCNSLVRVTGITG